MHDYFILSSLMLQWVDRQSAAPIEPVYLDVLLYDFRERGNEVPGEKLS